MAESLTNYRITSRDQSLYIDATRIWGAQSISISKNLGLNNVNYAGIGQKQSYYIPYNQQITLANIESFLLTIDPFIYYVTGNPTFNAYILKNNTSINPPVYSMLNGYMSNYSHEYSVGTLPKINASLNILGNAGQIPTGSLGNEALLQLSTIQNLYSNNTDAIDWGQIIDNVASSEDWLSITGIVTEFEDWNLNSGDMNNTLLIPSNGSISLDIDDFQTNRVLAYSININSQKTPIYNMGSRSNQRIDLVYPIDVACQFTFEVGAYQSVQMNNIPQNNIIKNLNLIVNDYRSSQNIASYSFSNLNLLSETYGCSTNGNATVTVGYNTKIYGN